MLDAALFFLLDKDVAVGDGLSYDSMWDTKSDRQYKWLSPAVCLGRA